MCCSIPLHGGVVNMVCLRLALPTRQTDSVVNVRRLLHDRDTGVLSPESIVWPCLVVTINLVQCEDQVV